MTTFDLATNKMQYIAIYVTIKTMYYMLYIMRFVLEHCRLQYCAFCWFWCQE